MSALAPPPDNSLAVEQSQEAAAAKAKSDADAKAATDAANLSALRTSSAGNANKATQDYFGEQGLDPTAYSGDINSHISQLLNGISPTDPNPGSSFATAPQDIFSGLTKSAQNKALQGVNSIFSPDYSTSKVQNSITDPYINDIAGSQRQSADDIINNMLKRGVITGSGKAAAEGELDRQAPSVIDQLKTIGQGTVSSEQSALDNIANKGRQTAQTLNLGQSFDPSTYETQADQQFNDFVNSLGNTIKGKVTGNLFNTTGLAAIAGAGQGAGNTNFDPTAAAGVIGANPDDGSTDATTGLPTAKQSNTSQSVF